MKPWAIIEVAEECSSTIPVLLPASETVESVDVIMSSAVVITEETVVVMLSIIDEVFIMAVVMLPSIDVVSIDVVSIEVDVEVIASVVKFKSVAEMFKITIINL